MVKYAESMTVRRREPRFTPACDDEDDFVATCFPYFRRRSSAAGGSNDKIQHQKSRAGSYARLHGSTVTLPRNNSSSKYSGQRLDVNCNVKKTRKKSNVFVDFFTFLACLLE
jgi:hypothetical protein